MIDLAHRPTYRHLQCPEILHVEMDPERRIVLVDMLRHQHINTSTYQNVRARVDLNGMPLFCRLDIKVIGGMN